MCEGSTFAFFLWEKRGQQRYNSSDRTLNAEGTLFSANLFSQSSCLEEHVKRLICLQSLMSSAAILFPDWLSQIIQPWAIHEIIRSRQEPRRRVRVVILVQQLISDAAQNTGHIGRVAHDPHYRCLESYVEEVRSAACCLLRWCCCCWCCCCCACSTRVLSCCPLGTSTRWSTSAIGGSTRRSRDISGQQ